MWHKGVSTLQAYIHECLSILSTTHSHQPSNQLTIRTGVCYVLRFVSHNLLTQVVRFLLCFQLHILVYNICIHMHKIFFWKRRLQNFFLTFLQLLCDFFKFFCPSYTRALYVFLFLEVFQTLCVFCSFI